MKLLLKTYRFLQLKYFADNADFWNKVLIQMVYQHHICSHMREVDQSVLYLQLDVPYMLFFFFHQWHIQQGEPTCKKQLLLPNHCFCGLGKMILGIQDYVQRVYNALWSFGMFKL